MEAGAVDARADKRVGRRGLNSDVLFDVASEHVAVERLVHGSGERDRVSGEDGNETSEKGKPEVVHVIDR